MATSTSTPSSDRTDVRSFEFEIPDEHLEHLKDMLESSYDFVVWQSRSETRMTTIWKGSGDVRTVSLIGVMVEKAWAGRDHGAFAHCRR